MKEVSGAMIRPQQIIDDDAELTIVWQDGETNVFTAPNLRRACACAQCVQEWTREQLLKPETVPEDLTISSVGIVGNYALNPIFSDKHDTGIYSFKYLREIGEANN